VEEQVFFGIAKIRGNCALARAFEKKRPGETQPFILFPVFLIIG